MQLRILWETRIFLWRIGRRTKRNGGYLEWIWSLYHSKAVHVFSPPHFFAWPLPRFIFTFMLLEYINVTISLYLCIMLFCDQLQPDPWYEGFLFVHWRLDWSVELTLFIPVWLLFYIFLETHELGFQRLVRIECRLNASHNCTHLHI